MLAAIPSVVHRLDSNLPVEDLRTIDDQIWDNVTRDRVLATLSSSFAALAALLAAIGLYAVLTYTVAQRLKEFGIRLAIGARPSDVRRLIVAQVGRMAAIGTAIGLVAAVGLGRLGESLLFELQGNDPALIAGAAVAMAAIALAAGCCRPAARCASSRSLRFGSSRSSCYRAAREAHTMAQRIPTQSREDAKTDIAILAAPREIPWRFGVRWPFSAACKVCS